MRFTGKTAIVTGGGGGLGAAYARALTAEGANVALLDLDAASVERTQRDLGAGGKTLALAVDLRDCEATADAAGRVAAEFGRIDILINNAGGGSSSPGNASSIAEISPDAWSSLIGINLDTAFNAIKAVSPAMKAQRYGRIVNVSSRSARVADPGFEQSPAYACAKTAVLGLTRFAARELGKFGVTVNCLTPSMVISGPVLKEYWERLDEGSRARYLHDVALKRLPEIDEMVGPVLFLSSDAASYVTGVSLDVNGGSYMPA